MTRTEYDVVALGELLIDFTAQGAGADGYPLMAAHPGGAPANFLAAIARLGGRTALLSKVGADAFGTMLTGTLREVGVDTRGVVVAEDAFTTLAFVTLAARGERSFSFARKPGADTQLRFEELDLSLIEKTKAFHFGTLSLTDEPARGGTQRAVAFAKERGKLITFDPNLRPPLWRSLDDAREQMLWGLGQADVVKLSDNEVGFLFGLSPREGAAYIRERFGTQLVFVTCGADGCEFASLRAQGHVDGLKGLTVTDTTGAGDIFGGCAVWRLLQSGKAPAALDEAELRGMLPRKQYQKFRQVMASIVTDGVRVEDKTYCIDERCSIAIVLTTDDAGSQYVRNRLKSALQKEGAFEGILDHGTKLDVRFACKEYDKEKYGDDMMAFKSAVESELVYDV